MLGVLPYPQRLAKLLDEARIVPEGVVAHNLAIPAHGPQIPALCTDKLLQGVPWAGTYPARTKPLPRNNATTSVAVDVALVEYSLNMPMWGEPGLSDLLSGLRSRYPAAAIVYVDLYSIRDRNVWELPSHNATLGPEHRWVRTSLCSQRLADELAAVEGLFYSARGTLARAGVAQIKARLGDDQHHLNANGHQAVAEELRDLLLSASPLAEAVGSGVQQDGDVAHPACTATGAGGPIGAHRQAASGCWLWYRNVADLNELSMELGGGDGHGDELGWGVVHFAARLDSGVGISKTLVGLKRPDRWQEASPLRIGFRAHGKCTRVTTAYMLSGSRFGTARLTLDGVYAGHINGTKPGFGYTVLVTKAIGSVSGQGNHSLEVTVVNAAGPTSNASAQFLVGGLFLLPCHEHHGCTSVLGTRSSSSTESKTAETRSSAAAEC